MCLIHAILIQEAHQNFDLQYIVVNPSVYNVRRPTITQLTKGVSQPMQYSNKSLTTHLIYQTMWFYPLQYMFYINRLQLI